MTGFGPGFGPGFSPAPVPTGKYGRALAALLPPGRLWRLIPGASTITALLAGCADELERVEQRALDLLRESDPRTASQLLPEFERELALAEAPTLEERRARVVAQVIREQGFRPVDFQTALAPLLGLDPGDIVVIERSRAFVITLGDDREIYRFFIFRDPGLPGTYFLASAQELVTAMAPSHTIGTVIESISMLCDDPFSLTDRDLMGA